MKKILFSTAIICLFSTLSCHNHDDTDATDTVSPILTLTSPIDNAVITLTKE